MGSKLPAHRSYGAGGPAAVVTVGPGGVVEGPGAVDVGRGPVVVVVVRVDVVSTDAEVGEGAVVDGPVVRTVGADVAVVRGLEVDGGLDVVGAGTSGT